MKREFEGRIGHIGGCLYKGGGRFKPKQPMTE